MEVSKKDLILVSWCSVTTKGLHPKKSVENVKQHFGKNALRRIQVFFCCGEFRRGRRSFDDEHRFGTPVTAVTVTNIETAGSKIIIRAESRITIRQIQECLIVGTAANMSKLHDHLCVRKWCANWILHSLTEQQRGSVSSCCERSRNAV